MSGPVTTSDTTTDVRPPEPQPDVLEISESRGLGVEPGHLAHLGTGADELRLMVEHPARVLLVGGVPFEEQLLMWRNFVARTREEILAAHADWTAGQGRFGQVASGLACVEVGRPPWSRP